MLRQNQGHQQAGSDPLLETFLTAAVMDMFQNSTMFGGVLVALTATLISDVANQDPSTTVAYLLRYSILTSSCVAVIPLDTLKLVIQRVGVFNSPVVLIGLT